MLLLAGRAHAQPASGEIVGIVDDGPGALVQLAGGGIETTVRAGAEGWYRAAALPPGLYRITASDGTRHVEQTDVQVLAGQVARVDLALPRRAPPARLDLDRLSDPVSPWPSDTQLGAAFLRFVPEPRDFAAAAVIAPGAQPDALGIALAGTTSMETRFTIDGVDVTSIGMNQPTIRASAATLSPDFLEQLRVLSTAMPAEYGGAMGGFVEATVKSGANRPFADVGFHFDPSVLGGRAAHVPVAGQSITSDDAGTTRWDLFADAGGAIVPDHLLFYVGIEPIFLTATQRRTVSALVDANHDGVQDFANGQFATRELSATDLDFTTSTLQWVGKLDLLISPEHRLSLGYYGSPETDDGWRILGSRLPSRNLYGAQEVRADWTSSLWRNHIQLNGRFDYHRERFEHEQVDPVEGNTQVTYETDPVARGIGPSVSWFSMYENQVGASCDVVSMEGAGTAHPADPNSKLRLDCPAPGYQVGGRTWDNVLGQRLTGRLAATGRFDLVGHHEVRAGWDAIDEDMRWDSVYPGGGYEYFQETTSGTKLTGRYFYYYGQFQQGGAPIVYPFQPETFGPDTSLCTKPTDIPGGASFKCTDSQTLTDVIYVRDEWHPLPNVVVNAGVRWERQSLSVDAFQAPGSLPPPNLLLDGNWAPRVAAAWSPLHHARIYGSFSRYYEHVPLDLNARALSGEVDGSTFVRGQCLPPGPCSPGVTEVSGGSPLIAPGVRSNYTDEIAGGVDYALRSDLAVGLGYIHRSLGTVLEDTSSPAGDFYLVNPGEPQPVGALQAQAAAYQVAAMQAMAAGNQNLATQYIGLASRYSTFADQAQSIAGLPKPRRDYDAVTLALQKRFGRRLAARVSYTYARTIGNYPGLYDSYLDQRDPNLSQLFDLPQNMLNRDGPLPSDIPHQLKIDGYYAIPLRGEQRLVVGSALRAQSGTPRTVRAFTQTEAGADVFVLPALGRNDATASLDLQVTWVRALPHGTTMEVFLAAYNLLDSSGVLARDDVYTTQIASPIVDGRMEDLGHLKTTSGAVVTRNATFGLPTAYQAPLVTRMGARFTF